MTTQSSRPERKDEIGRRRPQGAGRGRAARLAALLALTAVLCLGAAPARAATGGAATKASIDALTGAGLAFAPMRWAGATWYGPGLYGRHTACGNTLRRHTVGVAHKTLPCNTPVRFVYHGRVLIARVIDRGPYSRGNAWDLTNGAREALGFEGADRIGYSIGRRPARR
jgi:hypothetical protein